MNTTLNYYNQNAATFADGTIEVTFAPIQDRFLSYLPKRARILDLGCGSGRDTAYFLKKGYQVDATDGSEEICCIASENTGIPVRHMLFSELDSDSVYDGIWACASILHLPKEELADTFRKILRATKPQGYIYTSFKYGNYDGYRDGRYYTDFTEETMIDFLTQIHDIKLIEQWITSDVRPDRGDEKWLNMILQRSDTL